MKELLAPPSQAPASLEQLLGLVFPDLTKLFTEEAPPIPVMPQHGKTPSADDPRLGPAMLEAGTALLGPVKAGGAAKFVPAMFAGVAAKTADRAALAKAEQMAAKGLPREQIWNDTGWFQGADQKWRFEIPDDKAKLGKDAATALERGGVGDNVYMHNADRVMPHPELHAAYPDLWSVNTQLTKGGGYPYSPSARFESRESGKQSIHLNAPDASVARSMNLHELQHAVQQREGFAPGGGPSQFTQQKDAELARTALSWRREMDALPKGMDWSAKENAVIQKYRDIGAMDWVPPREVRDLAHSRIDNPDDQLQQLVTAYGLDRRVTPLSPMEMYRGLPGEVEARNVEARANMTPDERRASPPWTTEDILKKYGLLGMLAPAAAAAQMDNSQ